MITITQGPTRAAATAYEEKGAQRRYFPEDVAEAAAVVYERLRKRANRAAPKPSKFGFWGGYKRGMKDALDALLAEL